MNIYENCPEFSSERFLLRLVTEQDCDDLLKVYSDVATVPLFNSDNCNGDDFHYTSLERMMQAIQLISILCSIVTDQLLLPCGKALPGQCFDSLCGNRLCFGDQTAAAEPFQTGRHHQTL